MQTVVIVLVKKGARH